MIGIDIIEISRIRALLNDSAFIQKVYTDKEVTYCRATKSKTVMAQRFAARFAAKEAIFKAIPAMKALVWKEIEITNEASGKPVVHFLGKSHQLMKKTGLSLEISLSHSRNYAVAAAILK